MINFILSDFTCHIRRIRFFLVSDSTNSQNRRLIKLKLLLKILNLLFDTLGSRFSFEIRYAKRLLEVKTLYKVPVDNKHSKHIANLRIRNI